MNEKQVWLKDGKLQVYTNHWEEISEPTPVVHVTGVTLDQDSASLEPEETLQLTATVAPSDATDKRVTWTSSDEAVATVSPTWLVTAVADWDATITVKTKDWNFTATCAVAVSSYVPEVTAVALSSFDPQTPATIFTGRSMWSGIQVTPYTASNVHVTITSSDPEVIQVWEITYDPEPSEFSVGYVTLIGVATGTATVTITSQDDPTVSATYSFVVEQNVPVTAISNLSTNATNVYNFGAPMQIATVDYTPTNAVLPNWDVGLRVKEGETSIGRGYPMPTETPWTLTLMFQVDDQTAHVWDSAVYEVYLTNDSSFTPLEITLTVANPVMHSVTLDIYSDSPNAWEIQNNEGSAITLPYNLSVIDGTLVSSNWATLKLTNPYTLTTDIYTAVPASWMEFVERWYDWSLDPVIIDDTFINASIEPIPVVNLGIKNNTHNYVSISPASLNVHYGDMVKFTDLTSISIGDASATVSYTHGAFYVDPESSKVCFDVYAPGWWFDSLDQQIVTWEVIIGDQTTAINLWRWESMFSINADVDQSRVSLDTANSRPKIIMWIWANESIYAWSNSYSNWAANFINPTVSQNLQQYVTATQNWENIDITVSQDWPSSITTGTLEFDLMAVNESDRRINLGICWHIVCSFTINP